MSDRSRARTLAAEALEAEEPKKWFETLYREAAEGHATVPWADLVPNPHLVDWLDRSDEPHAGRALDVGCGYGDNAAELARRGFDVLAFDISRSAVARAEQRFGDLADFQTPDFQVSDAANTPPAWASTFDLVVEIYTLQVLPPAPRAEVAARLATLVRPGGRLVIICRGRDDDSAPSTTLPWPLTPGEIKAIGLEVESFEDFMDDEQPPVRRFRATLRKPAI